MKQLFTFLVVVLGILNLTGCQPSAIGEAETNKAFPEASQADIEATLAKEGKLEEYKAAQERDRAYQAQGQASTGEQGTTP